MVRGVDRSFGIGRGRTLLAGAAIAIAVGAFAYGVGQAAHAADAPDVVAYNEAVASGDPGALRAFVLDFPTSPLAQDALAKLQKYCTQHLNDPSREALCDLESLILPAAGVTDPPKNDPPNGGTNDGASQS